MSQKVTSFDRPLVLAVSDTYSVLYAGWGDPPPGAVKEDATLITGEIAELLYESLAGHSFNEHPEVVSVGRARLARSIINTRVKNMRSFANDLHHTGGTTMMMLFSAQAVLMQHSNIIMPWLGITMLNDRGNPVLDTTEYKPIRIHKQ